MSVLLSVLHLNTLKLAPQSPFRHAAYPSCPVLDPLGSSELSSSLSLPGADIKVFLPCILASWFGSTKDKSTYLWEICCNHGSVCKLSPS